jgi:hypothetical protein
MPEFWKIAENVEKLLKMSKNWWHGGMSTDQMPTGWMPTDW